MPVVRIADLADARLADYRHVPDPELLRRGRIFVAEGRLVVRTLLTASRLSARSLLVTDTALAALADVIEPRLDTLDVFVVATGVIEGLTGFDIHRGCLAIGERPATASIDTLVGRPSAPEPSPHRAGAGPGARTLVVLEQVGNADNVGSVFRNTAAFAADGVVLGPGCCDPLYRKAIRVSMGAALRVPFASAADGWPAAIVRLREAGFTVVALTPRLPAQAIDAFAAGWTRGAPLAVVGGAEGEGLTDGARDAANVTLRIPMAAGVDSLNVATAIAIALQRLGPVD